MKFSHKGDRGETSLLGGQRIPKFDPRPDTYGTLDEASSMLGVVKSMTQDERIRTIVFDVQKDLLLLGAELSMLPEDAGRYEYRLTKDHVDHIEEIIDSLQENFEMKQEFIYPGGTALSAFIDVARTIIRRAERKAAKLRYEGIITNEYINSYLNRLADMLFTLARYEEHTANL